LWGGSKREKTHKEAGLSKAGGAGSAKEKCSALPKGNQPTQDSDGVHGERKIYGVSEGQRSEKHLSKRMSASPGQRVEIPREKKKRKKRISDVGGAVKGGEADQNTQKKTDKAKKTQKGKQKTEGKEKEKEIPRRRGGTVLSVCRGPSSELHRDKACLERQNRAPPK